MPELAHLHSPEKIHALLNGTIGDPHSFLGMHPLAGDGEPAKGGRKKGTPALVVRAFVPGAEAITLVERGGAGLEVPLERIHDAGIFAATIADRREVFPYDYRITRGGHTWLSGDPYRFLPTLGDMDLYLAGEGTHRRLYEVL